MAESVGFWSYVHADDNAELGRITQLGNDIVTQYELITGGTVPIFLDKNIEWGEDWRQKIDENLSSVVFFIPIVTPRYLLSVECRRELQYFASRAINLGIKELILPIIYIDYPELHNKDTTDELIKLICSYQWVDWKTTRFCEITSQEYRMKVAELAQRINNVNKVLENKQNIEIVDNPNTEEIEDNEPGILDLLASAEESMPICQDLLNQIGVEINKIGDLAHKATEDLERSKKTTSGFGPRIMISKRLAKELDEPVESICNLTQQYASRFHSVDQGYQIYINHVPQMIEDDPKNRKDICEFFSVVRELDKNANEALDKTQSFINVIESTENLSRDLRPVYRKLRQGLIVLTESRDVSINWVRMIDALDIDCNLLESNNNN
jgi:hypothetical protein